MNFGKLSMTGLPVQFASPIGATAWAVLACIPVGIIALYFLKLRRRPVQVPSTLLWRRSLEDLHVNSLFQRLRRNLLLFLQLLAVLLVMIALLGPRVRGTTTQGQRYVIVIDNSASMSATDVAPSRLARAKAEAKKVVQSMQADDLAMVISFADRARIVSNYTGDHRLLSQRIDAIEPTQASTSLRDALQVAAGLANPSRTLDPGEGVVATSVVTPKLMIYTDGGFADVEGFSLGNLEPQVVVIGPPIPSLSAPSKPTAEAATQGQAKFASDNVAILALQTRKNDEKVDDYQVFGRVHNYRDEPVETEARLLRHDPAKAGSEPRLIDVIALNLPARSDQSFKFDIPADGTMELEVRIDVKDAQAMDNRAFALIGNPRKAQVLLITPGNRYLVDTLQTPSAIDRADVVVATPDESKSDPIERNAKAGKYDLVIYDQYRPTTAPDANAIYFGVMPPGEAYEKAKDLVGPVILDWDVTHPLMQYIRDLSNVAILHAKGVEPHGARVLIESNLGPLAFVAPRDVYSDVVITFPLIEKESFNTTWFKNISFPLFLFNCIQILGNSREAVVDEVHPPGQPIVLRLESPRGTIEVTGPDGKLAETVSRSTQATYVFNRADQTGIYHARWGESESLPLVVNQFDMRESDIAPRGMVPEGIPPEKADAYKIKIGYTPVAGTRSVRPSRRDWWEPFAVGALVVLLAEWYIYNRRVYV